MENPNVFNIKSVIIEHCETSHKLFKTINFPTTRFPKQEL